MHMTKRIIVSPSYSAGVPASQLFVRCIVEDSDMVMGACAQTYPHTRKHTFTHTHTHTHTHTPASQTAAACTLLPRTGSLPLIPALLPWRVAQMTAHIRTHTLHNSKTLKKRWIDRCKTPVQLFLNVEVCNASTTGHTTHVTNQLRR